MALESKIKLPLFLLRLAVFAVLIVWVIDKFVKPGHAGAVFEKFYMMPGLDSAVIYCIGAVQLIIVLCFLLGIKKTIATLIVLLMHTGSTLLAYDKYLNTYEGSNILFWAAWPMLAACFTCFYLRDQDTMLSLNIK